MPLDKPILFYFGKIDFALKHFQNYTSSRQAWQHMSDILALRRLKDNLGQVVKSCLKSTNQQKVY